MSFDSGNKLIRPKAGPRKLEARVMITFGVVALFLCAREIPLPTIVYDAGLNRPPTGRTSIMALGFMPLLTGYVLVECAALFVPAWRSLRMGSQKGRSQLHRASIVAGMLLALGQGLVLVLGFERINGVVLSSRIVTLIIFMGATAALIGMVWFVDRDGLGHGFSALLFAAGLDGIATQMANANKLVRAGTIPISALGFECLGVAILVRMTLFLFSRYTLPETAPHALMISRPACGIAPLSDALIIWAALARAWGSEQLASPLAKLLVGLITAFLLAYLFNPPKRIAAVWNALAPDPPEGIPGLKSIMLESALFVGLAIAVQQWLASHLGHVSVAGAEVILMTALICDLVREFRARQSDATLAPVWEIHQTYTVPPAMRLLENEGMHPFARGLRAHSLLQFFGPYVPIQILVPLSEAEKAYALLKARWPSSENDGKDEDESA